MSHSLAGKREYRNEAVRIADLTVNTSMITDITFVNARVIGPAVLAPLGSTSIMHSGFGSPDLDTPFWETTSDRQALVGAVGVVDCTFSNCMFEGIGWAGPPSLRKLFESSADE